MIAVVDVVGFDLAGMVLVYYRSLMALPYPVAVAVELPKIANATLQFVSVSTSVMTMDVLLRDGQPLSVMTTRESPEVRK